MATRAAFDYMSVDRTKSSYGRRWTIILAGGEGERLRGVTTQRYGTQRPKQYCSFWGGQSMLQWTMDRTVGLVQESHTKVVIGNGHEKLYLESVREPICGEVIVQPRNYGTLPGILLPLSHIMAEDPNATVILMPSDHYIFPAEKFVERARRAMELAERFPDKLVLLGAVPDSPIPDYGWVQSEGHAFRDDDWRAKPVTAFLEKPGEALAQELYRRGWLWNTMIVAAKVSLLWKLAYECADEILHRFNTYHQALHAIRNGRAPESHRQLALEQLYSGIRSADFSRDVLQCRPERCAILPMTDVFWCDCGHPERLQRVIERAGESPAKPMYTADGRGMFHMVSNTAAAMR